MSTTITHKAKWTGKDPTMVRCTQLGEKVQVKPNGTVEVDQAVAQRLMREPEWVVDMTPKISDLDDIAAPKKTSMINEKQEGEGDAPKAPKKK